ncbi:MAG TPA: cytidine deaminase [Phaeodactylibacter sp.]|nr:cytidine deaminase [Phaeodactylibacter sp.]
MNKRTQSFEYEWFESADDLSPQDRELLQAARDALSKAYAPYSHFQVGAAARLEDGRIISGANQENAAYPMCLCAERVVLAAVESEAPGAVISALAIRVHSAKHPVSEPAAPCGACRQVIHEKEQRQRAPMRILLQGEKGPVIALQGGKDLLPFAFGGEFLL